MITEVPPVGRVRPRTLLDEILRAGEFTLDEWCERFERLANALGEDATLSVRQLQRWASGGTSDARPAARRVAARLWGVPFSTLVAPQVRGESAPSRPEALPTSGLPGSHAVDGLPAEVTDRHVAILQEVNDRHRHFDADHGGGSCRDSAVAYLQWACRLLSCRFARSETERAFKAVLSDMYQVSGWACHDLGDHGSARRYLIDGLRVAREIDDLPLIAGAFYRLGRVSIHQGRAQEAQRLWQLGQLVAQDAGCLASVAVLHANQAWAYAMLGHADLVRDSLARAEGELAQINDGVPSWARFFLAPADINGIAGVVYTCLATHPQHRTKYTPIAIDRSSMAFELRQPGETRSRAFDAISLTGGHLLNNDLEAAERYGHMAVDLAVAIDSDRAFDRLHGVAQLARPFANDSRIAGLLERIAQPTIGSFTRW